MIHIIGIYHAMSMYYSDSLNFDRKKINLIASIGSANAVEAYEWKKRQTWINQNDNRIEDNSENAVSLCFGNCIHIDGVDISFCSCYFQIYRFLSLFSHAFCERRRWFKLCTAFCRLTRLVLSFSKHSFRKIDKKICDGRSLHIFFSSSNLY